MPLAEVVKLADRNVQDIPRALRTLADQIEKGECGKVRAIVWVIGHRREAGRDRLLGAAAEIARRAPAARQGHAGLGTLMADDAYAAPEGEQKPKRNAEADKKILDLAKKRFKAAMEAESENRAKELDDLKFLASSPDDNFQWPTNVLEQRTNANQEAGRGPASRSTSCPSTSAR
jgi:hypothetical protein